MTEDFSGDDLAHWKRFIISQAARMALLLDELPFLRDPAAGCRPPATFEVGNEAIFLQEVCAALEVRAERIRQTILCQHEAARIHPHLTNLEERELASFEHIEACLRSAREAAETIAELDPPISPRSRT